MLEPVLPPGALFTFQLSGALYVPKTRKRLSYEVVRMPSLGPEAPLHMVMTCGMGSCDISTIWPGRMLPVMPATSATYV